MRRRSLAWIAAGCAFVALGTVAVPLAGADATDDTMSGLATCLHDQHALSVVFLIDTSGSLQSTDPGNDRVAAARLTLANLASLATIRDGGKTPDIEVLVAGFSSRFEVVVPWTALRPASLTAFDAPLLSFATRNDGLDTDFPTALVGAQRELRARHAKTCRAVLLFTDGKYDIEDGDSEKRRASGLTKEYAPGISLDEEGTAEQVEALGREFLCRTFGLADTLRTADVALITVALAARIEPVDQQFLRALSEGVGDGVTCGTAKRGTGAYLAAVELSELKRQFNRVTSAIGGGREVDGNGDPIEVCARKACESGRQEIPVDAATDRVTFLVDTGSAGVEAIVTLPGGAGEVTIPSGESGDAKVGGVQIRWTWVDDRTVNVEADLPSGAAGDEVAGDWSVTLVQPNGEAEEPARVDAYLYSGWSPRLLTETFLLEGVEQQVRIEIVDDEGEPVDATNYGGTLALTGSLQLGEGDREPVVITGPDDGGRFTFAYTAAKDSGATSAVLRLELRITTPSGIELAPTTGRAKLEVRRPDVYPTITTALVELSDPRGTARAEGEVEVVGGRDRTGCVWIADTTFSEVPEGVGSFRWSSTHAAESSCQQVLATATETIDLTVTPERTGSGMVRGSVVIAYHAGPDTETRTVEVPIEFRLLPPIDQGRRIGLFAAIMLVGLLAPIGALWILNRTLARFEPTAGLFVARFPIAARHTFTRLMSLGVYDDAGEATDIRTIARIADDGALLPVLIGTHECCPIDGTTDRAHSVLIDDLKFRAHVERNPFASPFGVVHGDLPLAAGPRLDNSSVVTDRVPLALAGTWYVVLPEDPAEVPDGWFAVEVIVIVAGRDLPAELVDAGATIDQQAGRLANALRELHAGRSTTDRVSATR